MINEASLARLALTAKASNLRGEAKIWDQVSKNSSYLQRQPYKENVLFNFKKEGTVLNVNKNYSGRPKSGTSRENVEIVREHLRVHPTLPRS